MEFKHEKLEVWQLSMLLVKEIYKVLKKFPKDENYCLTDQIKRSVVSIPLNIAEGSGRQTAKDFANFVRNSIASLLETDTALKVGIELNYITKNDYIYFDKLIEKIYFKLIALNKNLKRRS